jgi:hypothetical protein
MIEEFEFRDFAQKSFEESTLPRSELIKERTSRNSFLLYFLQ